MCLEHSKNDRILKRMKFIPRKLKQALAGLVASLSIGPAIAFAKPAPVQVHDPSLTAVATAPALIDQITASDNLTNIPATAPNFASFTVTLKTSTIATTDPAIAEFTVATKASTPLASTNIAPAIKDQGGTMVALSTNTALQDHHGTAQASMQHRARSTAPPELTSTDTLIAKIANTGQQQQAG